MEPNSIYNLQYVNRDYYVKLTGYALAIYDIVIAILYEICVDSHAVRNETLVER